jgi:hypothetical protein
MTESTAASRHRSRGQKVKDFVTFPLRAVTLFEDARWGLSDLATERFDDEDGDRSPGKSLGALEGDVSREAQRRCPGDEG